MHVIKEEQFSAFDHMLLRSGFGPFRMACICVMNDFINYDL